MIKDLLIPKTKEDVIESLKTFRLPSYKLSSYLVLNQYDVSLKETIRYFCMSYGLDPKKMEVVMLQYEYGIAQIFYSIFEEFKKDVIKHKKNDNYLEYIPELQFIGFYKKRNSFIIYEKTERNRFYGFCFPKTGLNKILTTVTTNQIKL